MKHLKLAIARAGLCGVMGGALFLLGGVRCTFAADFTVTSPGFFYSINGLSPEARVAARRKDIAPLVNDLIDWMKRERAKLSRHNEVAKAMDYMLKRIDVFTRFLEDGHICLSNNAAERELRGIALGRKSSMSDHARFQRYSRLESSWKRAV